jgi:hypothetical protein
VPSVSEKQRKFMAAVAHNPKFAKKAGIPQSVGKDFAAADEGRKMGGSPKSKEEHMARRAKSVTQRETAGEFGTSQSTVSRKVRKQGFERMGEA